MSIVKGTYMTSVVTVIPSSDVEVMRTGTSRSPTMSRLLPVKSLSELILPENLAAVSPAAICELVASSVANPSGAAR